MAWKNYNRFSKYKNTKIEYDGILFDSKKECRRWKELRTAEEAGAIGDLRRQVRFELIPAQREPDTRGPKGGLIKGRLIERKVEYVADFVYVDLRTGQTVVEDVKGQKDGAAYSVFVIKRKLMLQKYGIQITEV